MKLLVVIVIVVVLHLSSVLSIDESLWSSTILPSSSAAAAAPSSSTSTSSSSLAPSLSSSATSQAVKSNIVNMISSMNDKEKATLLEDLVKVVTDASAGTSTTGISTNTTGTSITSTSSNSSIEYDHRILTRLLQSSSSVKVTGSCDDFMDIYINSTHMSTGSWVAGPSSSPPVYFNPSTDTLAIRGIDSGGGAFYCHISFNDILLSLEAVANHFKCSYKDHWSEEPPTGWMDRDYDDSFWGGIYTTQWGPWWAEGLNHNFGAIYCRYHPVRLCEDGSEPYGGQCWCSRGYKSSNGLAPCDPCDDNAYSDALGSTMCRCGANSFSSNGYDYPSSCESCPG